MLALARNLIWLAVFGAGNGLYEWGDIFIPYHQRGLATYWQ
jgi:hypothetical protein